MSRVRVVIWFMLPIVGLLILLTFAGYIYGALAAAGLAGLIAVMILLIVVLSRGQSTSTRPPGSR
jgi:hypothetical protein